MLIAKMHELCSVMGLAFERFFIDNIHRLPTNVKQPRPIIIQFVSFLDKEKVLSRKHILRTNNIHPCVAFRQWNREHFSSETELNI